MVRSFLLVLKPHGSNCSPLQYHRRTSLCKTARWHEELTIITLYYSIRTSFMTLQGCVARQHSKLMPCNISNILTLKLDFFGVMSSVCCMSTEGIRISRKLTYVQQLQELTGFLGWKGDPLLDLGVLKESLPPLEGLKVVQLVRSGDCGGRMNGPQQHSRVPLELHDACALGKSIQFDYGRPWTHHVKICE